VATAAGVSVATVSKVLNGRADVGADTRARVWALLREHDYVERRAESRPPADQPVVELVFHGGLSAYSLEILQGVVLGATEAEVAVAMSVRPRRQQRKSTGAWVRNLAALGRLAVIDVVDDVQDGDLTALSRAHLPLVVIDPLTVPRRQMTSVGATNFAGGMTATQHLLDLGHRLIAYLGADVAAAHNQARMHGYRSAMETAAVEVPDGYVLSRGSSYEHGVAGGSRLLDLGQPPTAVFAATDEIAAGVIEAARVHGLRVPEDLSVVGYDDTGVARLLSPPLTTVRQPLKEMGQVALRTALRLAAGEKLESHHVELATELVVRRSTAPPAQPSLTPIGSGAVSLPTEQEHA
jgi:LacI family transcriptional regulator